jgi:hypothetical protein
VRNAKIPPLRPQNPQVEPELEDIVRKALAKRKEDRFQSATDLQDALAQYSYSRGLKVISRDIAELVRQCLDDKRMQSGEGKRPSIAEHILQGELVKFTSVDFEDQGAQPLTADELAPRVEAPAPHDGDFVDPRGWADERQSGGTMDSAEMRALESRRTSRDAPVTAPALGPPRAAERMRIPTGENRAPRNSPPVASPAESTPGPEALANVLEPMPGPQAPVGVRPGAAQGRSAQPGSRPARSFLIGALIGTVLLGAAVAVFVSKRGGVGGTTPHPAQPTP